MGTTIRELADAWNASASARRAVSTRFPEETVELCTAVTILDTPRGDSIGWSVRRFFQRRGNLVVTNRRLFVQSSLFSPFTVLWITVLVLSADRLASGEPWTWALAAAMAGLLVFQRRPYRRDLPFAELDGVRFGKVAGAGGHADILAVRRGARTLHLVASKPVPEKLKRRLEASICGEGTPHAAGPDGGRTKPPTF